eukprot:1136709-Pelagomonas_calceolata.AAC.8
MPCLRAWSAIRRSIIRVYWPSENLATDVQGYNGSSQQSASACLRSNIPVDVKHMILLCQFEAGP